MKKILLLLLLIPILLMSGDIIFDDSLPDTVVDGRPSELIEQPCGVFNGSSTKVTLGSPFTLALAGSAISFKASIDNLLVNDCLIGTTTTLYAQKIQFTHTTQDRIMLNDDSDKVLQSGNNAITDDDIHHFIFNLDGANSKIWIDGVNNTISNALEDDITLNLFGVRRDDRWHDGKLFDIAVYNKTLSTSELVSLNNDILVTDGLVHYYPDPSTGYDTSGNGNDGTVTGVTQCDVYPDNDYFEQYGTTWVTYGSDFRAVPYDITKTPIYDHASPIWHADEVYTEYPYTSVMWSKIIYTP